MVHENKDITAKIILLYENEIFLGVPPNDPSPPLRKPLGVGSFRGSLDASSSRAVPNALGTALQRTAGPLGGTLQAPHASALRAVRMGFIERLDLKIPWQYFSLGANMALNGLKPNVFYAIFFCKFVSTLRLKQGV